MSLEPLRLRLVSGREEAGRFDAWIEHRNTTRWPSVSIASAHTPHRLRSQPAPAPPRFRRTVSTARPVSGRDNPNLQHPNSECLRPVSARRMSPAPARRSFRKPPQVSGPDSPKLSRDHS